MNILCTRYIQKREYKEKNMNGQIQNGIHKSISREKKKAGMWARLTCAVFTVLFLFTSCIGCSFYASSDEVAIIKNQLADAMQEIHSLKEGNGALQQKMELLEDWSETAQREIDALKGSQQSAQQEIEALKDDYKTAQQEIQTLKSNDKASQQEIAELKGKYEAAQQEIDALKRDNEAAQKEIDRLNEQLEALQESIPPADPKIKIYIDQGHNPTSYHNSGASGNGLYEQDLTFTVGCLLAQLLEEDGRFEICLSRPTADTVLGTDNASSLEARVLGAQEFGADYFISLHTNSYEDESVNGIEVFVAEQDSTSYDFGNSLLEGLIESTNLRDRGMKLNPDLYVLKNATMPAALLEMGFITNSGDAALLAQSPALFAQGIYNGILTYFELRANDSPTN